MSVITAVDCRKIIEYNKFNKDLTFDFKVTPLSKECAGFLGSHYELRIVLDPKSETKEENITINAFVKALPMSPDHQQYVQDMNAFNKEYENFKKLFPLLQEISKKNNCFWSPQCFLTKSNALVYEDLSEKGFQLMKFDAQFMDLEHVKIAAKILAYFHSASTIFEMTDQNNCISTKFGKCVEENIFVEDPKNIRYHWFECGMLTIIKIIERLKKYSNSEMEKISAKIMALKSVLKDYFKPSKTKMNVICHGDLWPNNFMFRYENGKPIECRLVDFQLTRYAPGALDLACMLQLCLDSDTRRLHRDEIVKTYEEAFRTQISAAGFALPKLSILEDVEYFRLAAVVECLLFEMVTQLDKNTVAELLTNNPLEFFYGDRSKVVMMAFERNVSYRNRLTETVQELINDFIITNLV